MQQPLFLLDTRQLLWMEFESYQKRSKLENISKFTNCMKSTLEKAKSAIYKSQESIVKYYNWKYTPTMVFCPGSKVFLDFLNIYITCLFTKLSHCLLRSYIVEKQVELILYYLKLSSYFAKIISSISGNQAYCCLY